MEPRAHVRILRAGERRSVVVESDDGREVIVKRFHHPHRLHGLRDRSRALNEVRALELLHDAGLRVPAPLGVERTANGWAVRMEHVPDATPLDTLLRQEERPVGGWPRLMTGLGRLLAGLHSNRIEHVDLHAGNVLVDRDGTPWLIDFHQAHQRRRDLTPGRMLADVIAATAEGRDWRPATERVRFALAWRAALPTRLARSVEVLGADALDELERRGRVHRRAVVERGARRWLRASGRCRLEGEGGERLVRRDLPAGGGELMGSPIAFHGAHHRQHWISAARLLEHGVSAVRPAVLDLVRERAIFEPPPGPIAGAPEPAELGRILGTLHDRGLDVAQLGAEQVVKTSGGVYLLPPPALGTIDPRALVPERFRSVRSELGPRPPETFRRAYLAVFADRPREHDSMAAALA